jgi:hypothetical protein
MKCQCGDKATKWVEVKGVNLPKCEGCHAELTKGFVPQPTWSQDFTPRFGLTPRQAHKLGETGG